ncbi:MAG TPA: Mov34/MPN/PAD-1 family protein, partial [Myxococcaceae bacterium]
RIQLMENAYDRYHLLEPQNFPRTSRTGYLFDPREQLAVYRDADARGEEVACIFHSHVDGGAHFSGEDRAMAAPDGVPMAPGVSYLVVSVRQRRASAARLYRFLEGDFQGTDVPLPPRS